MPSTIIIKWNHRITNPPPKVTFSPIATSQPPATPPNSSPSIELLINLWIYHKKRKISFKIIHKIKTSKSMPPNHKRNKINTSKMRLSISPETLLELWKKIKLNRSILLKKKNTKLHWYRNGTKVWKIIRSGKVKQGILEKMLEVKFRLKHRP